MNKDEVIIKLKKNRLSQQDKIDIFNWYIKEMSPEIIITTKFNEIKLSEQQIKTANSPNAKKQLNYSINKIKEKLLIK